MRPEYSIFASEEHEHNVEKNHEHSTEENHEHDENKENTSRIKDQMADQVGIVTATANPQALHQTISIYGSIVVSPEQLSHVRARFEGLIKSVNVTLGDKIKTGDVLARVESNDSLKTYSIRAPISGRVVQRHANTGEVTRDQILFSIADYETVWAELRVYPAQQASVSEGQSVHIARADSDIEARINHILPSMDAPYQLARVRLDNKNNALFPGGTIEARIEIGKFNVALAVHKDAVQMLGGRQGVFVKSGDEYRFIPLVLGRNDDHFYEVLGGLNANSEYVSQNSYLIKADIEKSEAEHDH